MIFGVNTTRDISKLSQISLAQRLVKLRITISKDHSCCLCQISLQIVLLPILAAFVAVAFNNYLVLPFFVAPGEPINLRTENPGKQSITLRWDEPVLHGKDVIRYKVTFELLCYILLTLLVY